MESPRPAALHPACPGYGSLADVRVAKAALVAAGRERIQEGSGSDLSEVAYFDFPAISSPVEDLFLDDARLGPPEKMI
ncbi:MAG: hypothetical protein AB7G12_01935 [Thermoanaerobaculia bacterium]